MGRKNPLNRVKLRIYLHLLKLCSGNVVKRLQLKAISRMKEAPWIFAHYQKIYNLCPILMKLCENDQPMR